MCSINRTPRTTSSVGSRPHSCTAAQARRSRSLRGIVYALTLALVLAPQPAAKAKGKGLQLESHLARDPVLVVIKTSADPVQELDRLLRLAETIDDEADRDRLENALDRWESRAGLSLRDDLLARLGPELALVLDLPSNETVAAAFSSPNDETIAKLLDGIGVVTQVRDPGGVVDSLDKLLLALGGTVREVDDLRRVDIALGTGSSAEDEGFTLHLSLYYSLENNTLSIGFSPEWVRASLKPRERGQRLADGADFRRVFSGLDAKRSGLFYLNLPKVAKTVDESPFIRLFAARNRRVRSVLDTLLQADYSGVGLGSTKSTTDGGSRTTGFGPPGLSAGSLIGAAIAAAVVPRILRAVDPGPPGGEN